jgi:hypothetical protein
LYTKNLHNFVPEQHSTNELKEIEFYLSEKKVFFTRLNTSELLLLSLVKFQISERQPADARAAIRNKIRLESLTAEMSENTSVAFLWHMATSL